MSTPTPAGIISANKVETRFGALKFFDGFPDKETTAKLFDNLDFQRGVQSYLLGIPAVSLVALKKGIEQFGPANSTLIVFENLMNAKSLFLTGNTNTPYTIGWLDLSKGPIVLESPPNVLGIIDDYWFKWVTDVGITGPDKGQGGKFLLLPPGYRDTVPEGYIVLRPHTHNCVMFFRSFLVNGDPKPGIALVKEKTKIYPLAEANSPKTPTFVDVSGKYFNTLGPADYGFWEYLNEVVQTEPSDALDPVTLGFFSSIGIQKGKPFAPDARMKRTLTEAAQVGDASARAITYRFRETDSYYYPNSSWRRGFAGGYLFEDNGARNLDGYSSFFFYATGVTPAMDQAMVGKGSQYAVNFLDSKGNPFDGGHSYKLHLPPNVPAKDFWSVTVYDSQTRSLLQNDQTFPTVGGDNKGLVRNSDGSVDVYFGPQSPSGKENNWIQTIPGKSWNTILRLYGPLQPWFDKTWRPSEIEEVSPGH